MPEMPEANLPPEHADVRYEKSDAWIGSVIAFGIALAVMTLIVQISAAWLFHDLKERAHRKYQPLPSLAAKERARLPRDLGKIPEPRLQQSEPRDLAELREREEALLTTYGWVDRKGDIVRIPINEAMKLLADPKTAAAHGVRVRVPREGGK